MDPDTRQEARTTATADHSNLPCLLDSFCHAPYSQASNALAAKKKKMPLSTSLMSQDFVFESRLALCILTFPRLSGLLKVSYKILTLSLGTGNSTINALIAQREKENIHACHLRHYLKATTPKTSSCFIESGRQLRSIEPRSLQGHPTRHSALIGDKF